MRKPSKEDFPPEFQNEIEKYGLVEYDKPLDLKTDERVLKKSIEAELKYDQSLDPIAEQVLALYEKAQSVQLPSVYWEIGDVILKFEKRMPKDGRESYQKKTNFLQRVSEKIDDLIAAKQKEGKWIPAPRSLRYLREFCDFRTYRTKSQVDDSIPWSIQFEFLELETKAWKRFVSAYKRGKLADKEQVREAVHLFKEKGKLP